MNFCIFCKAIVDTHNLVNIQLSTTQLGNVNIEDFIKDNILGVHSNTKLHSYCLCAICHKTVNQLEKYLINSKNIQELLLKQYEDTVPIKQEHEDSLEQEDSFPEVNDMPIELSPEIEVSKVMRHKRIQRKKVIYFADDDDEEEQDEQHNINIKLERIEKKDSNNADGSNQHNKHLISHLNVDVKQQSIKTYCCEICGQHYVNYNGFNIHMRTHKNENAFRCEICNKTFTQKIGLQRHMDIHSGVYPYTCELCGKKYIHQKSYKIHLDIHSGKRDYQCDLCGLGLLTTSHLQRHMKTHTREKTFGCNECGKMFAEKYNLAAHKKIHAKHNQEIATSSFEVRTKDEVVT